MAIEALGPPGLARRRLLGAALACAALWGCRREQHSAPNGPAGSLNGAPLLVLTDSQAVTLASFAGAVLQGSPLPDPVTPVLRRLDEELYFVDEAVRSDVGAALAFLDWYPVLRFKFHRFADLGPERRSSLIEEMITSRFETPRAVANSLRVAVLFFHYAHPSSWSVTGYDGPYSHFAPQMSEQRLRYLELTKTGA